MKKILTILALLFATTALARPVKEICRELGPGCQSVDSPDLIELKLLFNEINQKLIQSLHSQQEFNAGVVIARKNVSDVEISRLEAIRDNLTNQGAKDALQVKIDRVITSRDFLDKNIPNEDGTDPPRVVAGKLGPVIASLNLQLNDLQREINLQ